MNRELVEIVAQYALFLERADESEISLEAAVRQQEDLTLRLQKLNSEERREFVRLLLEIANEMSSADDRQILQRLPYDVGIHGVSNAKGQSQNPLVGTWKLLALQSQSTAGDVSHPFGDDARGLLTYDAHGRMSVVLTRADRPQFVSGDPARGTPEEIKTAFEGFSAYYGTYDIDQDLGTVTHHVEANSFPNWVGTDQQRFFTLTGRRLTLRTPPMLDDGQTVTLTAVWEHVDMATTTGNDQVTHRWYTRPVLFVADVNRALRFYIDILGFEKGWHEGDGTGGVCQVNRAECELILCEDAARTRKARLFVELTQEGFAELRHEIAEHSVPNEWSWWGYDVIKIVDPDGNELLFPVSGDSTPPMDPANAT